MQFSVWGVVGLVMLWSEPLALCVCCSENECNEVKVLIVCSPGHRKVYFWISTGYLRGAKSFLSARLSWSQSRQVFLICQRDKNEDNLYNIIENRIPCLCISSCILPHINDIGGRVKCLHVPSDS